MKKFPIITYINAKESEALVIEENKGKSGIYRWTHLITGKSYVGSSNDLKQRFTTYYSNKDMRNRLKRSRSIIYRAILKYGRDNFSLDILEYCKKNVLLEREQYYIDLLKPKYNILKVVNSRLSSNKSK